MIIDSTTPISQQPEPPHGTASTPGTSIAPLPPECLEFILEFLSHDLPTLYRCLFVSWQFFHITVPVLYKSPFKLAAGMSAPPSASPHSPASVHSLSSSSYSSTTDPNMGGWTRFLRRTELLVRLLLQNIHTPTLSSRAPRLTERQALIMDTPVPHLGEEYGRVEVGLEQLGSLLGGATDHPNGWDASPNDNSPSAKDFFYLDPSLQDDAPLPNSQAITVNNSDGHSGQLPDLISFDDDDHDRSRRVHPHQPSERSCAVNMATSSDSKQPGTGLLTDYFRYYTKHDHQSISSVLILLFPGAGRREYDRILAEIERSILEHNPGKIVALKIQHPSTVIPHLMQHLSLFHRLSRVELLDSNWTSQELALVCEFLEAHSAMFPGASPHPRGHPLDSSYNNDMIQPNNFGHRHELHGIRHIKYRTGRSHWDGVKLRNQPFNPVQLVQAIGSGTGLGLETIDSMHWPETTFEQVNALDTRFLSKLKICFLVTPHEDRSFSQPKFLERCRELRHLEVFTSSADMLRWAVQEWNDSIRHKKRQLSSSSNLHPAVDKKLCLHDPWIQGISLNTQRTEERPLVPLHHLHVHGSSNDIVYSVLRDALYGFRNTLEVCEAKSKLEYNCGNSEWLDHADELLSRRPAANIDQRNKDCRAVSPGGERRASELDRPPTNHNSENKDEDELAEECYLSMPSIESGLLTVRWTVPYLAMLDLNGSIALQFDLKSLAYMPRLHTVCFSIRTAPSLWRRRYRKDDPYGGVASRYAGVSDLTCLPQVTGPRLKRILIRGPWPEISDRSLLEMIETRVESNRQNTRDEDEEIKADKEGKGIEEDEKDGDEQEEEQGNNKDRDEEEGEEATWGNQLLELTVLDNDQVTVPGMVLLARQMDQLEVMGLSLYFPVYSQYPYHHSQHRQQQQDMSYSYPSNIIQRSYHYFCNPSTGMGPSPSMTSTPEDAETTARNELLKAQLELPWVDLGPDANHLAKRTRLNGFLNRGWIL